MCSSGSNANLQGCSVQAHLFCWVIACKEGCGKGQRCYPQRQHSVDSRWRPHTWSSLQGFRAAMTAGMQLSMRWVATSKTPTSTRDATEKQQSQGPHSYMEELLSMHSLL